MMIHQIILSAAETVQNQASGGVIGTLGLNWKLFLAQLVNFSIVLFVFWKWIVTPLGKTLTDRQDKIEQGLKNAQATEEERKRFEEWRISEMRKARNESDRILRTTTDTANKIKQETIVESQNESKKLLEQTRSTIESEKNQMLKEVRGEIAGLVVMASEKILKVKLDTAKDKELIHDSLKHISK